MYVEIDFNSDEGNLYPVKESDHLRNGDFAASGGRKSAFGKRTRGTHWNQYAHGK